MKHKTLTICLIMAVFSIMVRADLVAHWKLDGDANDSVGTNHATLFGNPQWPQGVFNEGLGLDGYDDKADCSDPFTDVTQSTTKTITAWAKSYITDYSGIDDNRGRILTLYRDRGYSGYTIFAKGAQSTWQGLYATANNGFSFLDSGVSVNIDEWVHIGLVQDGSNVTIYINGVLKNSDINATSPEMNREQNATIGAFYEGTDWQGLFDGVIDDVRIYDHALTEQEIINLVPEPVTVLLLILGVPLVYRRQKTML